MPLLRFVVYGKPRPRGSKKAIPVFNKHSRRFVTAANGRPVIAVTDDNPNSGEWMQAVAASARHAMEQAGIAGLFEGPLSVRFLFVVNRPKGDYRKGGDVKPKADAFPAKKPDVLKLARCAEDSMTGVVYKDDAQIVSEKIEKRYGAIMGLEVEIGPADGLMVGGAMDYDHLGMEVPAHG